MNIVCVSSSNIKHAGRESTSLKVCELIKDMVLGKALGHVQVDIIPLAEYELKSCIGCGKCHVRDECPYDMDFTRIYDILCKADALFIISAHYAPIPSKLTILLEKIEQLAFLKRFHNENYRAPLYGKPVGIIGHGGGTEEIHKHYQELVINSIWNALSYPVEMNVIGIDDKQPRGVTFPVKSVKKVEGSIFPVHEYDWDDIKLRIEPLVQNVIEKLEGNACK